AVETVRTHAARKDIEIVSSIEEPPKFVSGDEGTLVETLVNILNNAVKYSRSGSQVLLKAEEGETDILISVTDSGIGISKEDLPYIFNDFYTGKSDQAVEKGSGIGLAITRRIVEAHHGVISVESEPGKGSTFMIRLPALKVPEHA
ncbi:MAG: HAMP domain-containing sensor histidine kinase, partial [Anaerolineales bacterium]|nr:HAMP domain-containing sensor histidine kinase [Anaerolineales bacterium]